MNIFGDIATYVTGLTMMLAGFQLASMGYQKFLYDVDRSYVIHSKEDPSRMFNFSSQN